jgi:signal transduction histidine kinase
MFHGKSSGSLMAKWLYPLMVVLILALGYLLLLARKANFVSDDFSISLFAISFLLIGLFLVWITARRLNFFDAKRTEAEIAMSKLNDELTAANLYLEQFAFISSHDVKAPVITMKGLVDVMYKTNAVKDEHIKLLDMMEGIIQQMQKTNRALNDILKLRKSLMNKEEMPAAQLSMQDVVNDVKTLLLPDINSAGARFEVDLDSVSDIRFPYVHLKSVLYNVIGNAVKYRDPQRDLVVKLQARQIGSDSISIQISDNGLGMDLSRNRERLFGIFRRFHKHVEGAGVGLHITRSIIEAYGGQITVDSEVGKGTRFEITLNNVNAA